MAFTDANTQLRRIQARAQVRRHGFLTYEEIAALVGLKPPEVLSLTSEHAVELKDLKLEAFALGIQDVNPFRG